MNERLIALTTILLTIDGDTAISIQQPSAFVKWEATCREDFRKYIMAIQTCCHQFHIEYEIYKNTITFYI